MASERPTSDEALALVRRLTSEFAEALATLVLTRVDELLAARYPHLWPPAEPELPIHTICESEPTDQNRPTSSSEPRTKRHPSQTSAPKNGSHPLSVSEPFAESRPSVISAPFPNSHPRSQSEPLRPSHPKDRSAAAWSRRPGSKSALKFAAVEAQLRAGRSLAVIRANTGVSIPTIVKYRTELRDAGIDLRCRCGKAVHHGGRCTGMRFAADNQSPVATKRAVSVEPPAIEQRAAPAQPPDANKRAGRKQSSGDHERAVSREPPDTEKRAAITQPPETHKRADKQQSPALNERAVTSETSDTGKRAVTSKSSMGAKRRFGTPDRKVAAPLAADHWAVVNGTTAYPARRVAAADAARLFKSGEHNWKIGKTVLKGRWAGLPIYTLTLEERATCSADCHHWLDCYGNAMNWSERIVDDGTLIDRIERELGELNTQHPTGFVVRLHVLGDFYSVDYVRAWSRYMATYSNMRVFGYTGWPKGSMIGRALGGVAIRWGRRWMIRWSRESDGLTGRMAATTIRYEPKTPRVADGLVCPAQTKRTECCATCALCWASEQPIVFIAH